MTALCNCAACDDMAARIRRARAMTEPERRRAKGEGDFCALPADVKISRAFLYDVTRGAWDLSHASPTLYACSMVAALLRALVQQELVERIVAWCEAEVMT